SQKGRELQACKRKKRELEEEEKRLIREYQPEFYFGYRIQ
ncbi:TPA: antirepressor protein, partial [Escherichia coli]